MSVFNADDDLLSNDEPVKSVEMEDVSATEMETAPCPDQTIGCTSSEGQAPQVSEVPIECGPPLDGAGSPIEMDRNSPTEKMVEAQDEPNDTEMETSNEMEVCPQDKEGELEQKDATFDELIEETSSTQNVLAVANGPTDENFVPALDAGDNSMDTDKQPAEDALMDRSSPENLFKRNDTESVSKPMEEVNSLKQDGELVSQTETEPPANRNEDESPTIVCDSESVPNKTEFDSVTNQNEESNPIGASDDVPCGEEKYESESTGRTSANCFATFDDESRLSNDKISVENVEDVNIGENTDTFVEGEEEATNEQEGEDPLEAGGVVDELKNDEDAEEEILGHIPVSGESLERVNEKTSEANSVEMENTEVTNLEERTCGVEEKGDAPKDKEKDLDYEELAESETRHCHQCNTEKECLFNLKTASECSEKFYLCSKECCDEYKNRPKIKAIASTKLQPIVTEEPEKAPDLTRRCFNCKNEIDSTTPEKLSWQSMEYCSERCIEAYQNELGACCANCKGDVPQASMGKYCVRFGYHARQFCSSKCLEEFKKGLKVCSYCQRDISGEGEGFLAAIGDKGTFKDFCSKNCMDDYDIILCNKPKPVVNDNCAVCSDMKAITIEVVLGSGVQRLCSDPCFAAFKFANNVKTDECELCKRHFDTLLPGRQRVYYNDVMHNFCSRKCLNVHTLSSRMIICCSWCKVKKYNFDMIEAKNPRAAPLCSLKCLKLLRVSQSAANSDLIKCDMCKKESQGSCHLTMSDSTVRNFCCYVCCIDYQKMCDISPIVDPSLISTSKESEPSVPIISNVTSLAALSTSTSTVNAATPSISSASPSLNVASSTQGAQIKIIQHTIVRPPPYKSLSNKSTFCKPASTSKGVMMKPTMAAKSCQTDFEEKKTEALVPVPVPIYVPVPLAMYSFPTPIPVPFPLPVPVPMFIPTTRNSAKGIFKEIKRIADQVPRDPFEAELLMMAEMVADDKKGNVTSDSDDDDRGNADIGAPSPMNDSDDAAEPPTPAPTNEPPVTPSFGGEDILQMAVNMAMEMTEPPATQPPSLDLETVLTPQPVVPIQPPPLSTLSEERNEPVQRGRKRGRGRGSSNNNWTSAKRTRASSRELSHHQEVVTHDTTHHDRSMVDSDNEPTIEADPDLQLKFSYGVLAFRKWIKEKNSELSLTGKAAKLFKTDILQLSTEELNFTLCMFVKEVRKPDGEEYAPDIIFYLCLGIQLYLYRNGRVDNIFTDAFYEKFTDCLNQVSSKFVTRLNDRNLLTRVEEEHLWESQQLGAHSPHVLLFTLMYFNTKYFYLTEVEDHMRLSFTHVMKHWKRNNTQPGKSGPSRNVLLRYYPPQSVLDADERKKKVYEQQENEINPLRCPVKLYEFYVSKCPESVRGRNDVFYLLPERSCVPDSPVWYSTMSMPKEAVSRMLNRIRMVREILCILHSLDYH